MSTLPEFADNPEDRCAVVLVLDTSYSMLDSDRIGQLNDGVRLFREEVLKDPVAALRIEVAVVKFGPNVEVVQDFKTVHDFTPPTLEANGGTPMGEAVLKALSLIEDRKATYRAQQVNYYRPWLWLMTDGQPTDNWKNCAQAARQAEQDKKVQVFTVGIGEDANESVLREFSSKPPLKLKGLEFREMFKWLSASLQRVSKDKAGAAEQVNLPPVDGWGNAYS